MNQISSISPLWNVFPSLERKETPAASGTSMFADVFRAAVDNVRATDDEKNKLEYLLATGQLDNPADLSFALYKADTAVDMLIQLRNKALDAYSELMRISM